MNTPRSRNYTLIELIVVIAIIMILAAGLDITGFLIIRKIMSIDV